MFAGAVVRDDRRGALPRVEAREEPSRDVLLGPQDAKARVRARGDPRGIGAEEGRRFRDHAARGGREVERDVMTLEAPCPRTVVRGSAEDRQVVAVRVPDRVALRFAQDALEENDTPGLLVAPRRKARAEHLHGGGALGRIQLPQRDAAPLPGHVAPARALLAFERQSAGRLMRRPQESEERARGPSDVGVVGREPRGREDHEKERRGEASHDASPASRVTICFGFMSVRCTGHRSAISSMRRLCSSDRGPESSISRSIRSIRLSSRVSHSAQSGA